MVRINESLSIPDAELSFETSTSSGPGGQHVNRSQTRITLRFDLDASAALSAEQKQRIRERLATRVDRSGCVSVRCGRHRSQIANRREATERFARLIEAALRRPRSRVATRVSRAQRDRRLQEKRARSENKQRRRRPQTDED